MRAIGVITTVVVILAAVVLGVGLWRDWFDLSATTTDSEESRRLGVSLNVNKEKFEADTARLRQSAQDVKESAEAAIETETLRGVITALDEPAGALTIENEDGEEASFSIGEATEVRIDDEEASPADLREGEAVTVVYRETDGERVAREIEVSRGDGP